MSITDLIRSRRSVRTFDGAPLPPDTAARILEYARTEAETPFGIPVDWRILDAEAAGLSSPVIVGARTWIAGKTDHEENNDDGSENRDQALKQPFDNVFGHLGFSSRRQAVKSPAGASCLEAPQG